MNAPHTGHTHVWEKVDLTFTAERDYANPYLDVDLWVDLEGPGFRKRVRGFWDGGRTFRVRLVTLAPGDWSWQSGATADDPGLVGHSGTLSAVQWSDAEIEANPNRRGFIGPTANGHALQYADGTPFFLLADTWWAAFTHRWPWREDAGEAPDVPAAGPVPFQHAVHFRKRQGFNTIAALACFPTWINDAHPRHLAAADGTALRYAWQQINTESAMDMHDEQGNRAFLLPGTCPGLPDVVPDFERINPAYFANLDRKFDYLNDQGLICVLEAARRDVGPPWRTYSALSWPDSFVRYLGYLTARYQAHSLIFSPIHLDMYRLPFTLTKDLWRQAVETWFTSCGPPAFGQLVTTNIAYSTLEVWGHVDAAPWLTMHQTGNSPQNHAIVDESTRIFHRQPPLPTLNGEPYYSGKEERPDSEEDQLRCRSAWYATVFCGGLAGAFHGARGVVSGHVEIPEPGDATITVAEGLRYRSGGQMRHLATLILSEGARYRDLVPHRELIAFCRPGQSAYEYWAYCLATEDRSFVLLYYERGVAPPQSVSGLPSGVRYHTQWFDPRSGEWSPVGDGTARADDDGVIYVDSFPDGDGPTKLDWAMKLVNEEHL